MVAILSQLECHNEGYIHLPLDPEVLWLLPMPAMLPSTTAQSCPITLQKLSSATLVTSQLSEHWAGSRELTGDMQHVINLGMTGIHSCHWHALFCFIHYHDIMDCDSAMVWYERTQRWYMKSYLRLFYCRVSGFHINCIENCFSYILIIG